jgi:hypothetical protein
MSQHVKVAVSKITPSLHASKKAFSYSILFGVSSDKLSEIQYEYFARTESCPDRQPLLQSQQSTDLDDIERRAQEKLPSVCPDTSFQ